MMPKDKEDDEEKEQLILVKNNEKDVRNWWDIILQTLGKAPQQHLLLLEVSTELVDAIPRALRGQGEEIHLGAAQFLM